MKIMDKVYNPTYKRDNEDKFKSFLWQIEMVWASGVKNVEKIC